MPNFHFSEVENERLQTAIMSFQREIQPAVGAAGRGRPSATTRSRAARWCGGRTASGCHEIEGDGGDYRTARSRPHLAPPLLTPEGAKVQPDWLYAFLQGPITIRPWLNVRMPTFGLDDGRWNAIIDYFEATGEFDRTVPDLRPRRADQHGRPGQRAVRRCCSARSATCSGAIPADQPIDSLAPDLRMAHERLKPEWILDWLRNPGADSARHADAAVLADAAVPEVVVPAVWRRCGAADPGDPGPPDDAARRAVARSGRRARARTDGFWLQARASGSQAVCSSTGLHAGPDPESRARSPITI